MLADAPIEEGGLGASSGPRVNCRFLVLVGCGPFLSQLPTTASAFVVEWSVEIGASGEGSSLDGDVTNLRHRCSLRGPPCSLQGLRIPLEALCGNDKSLCANRRGILPALREALFLEAPYEIHIRPDSF